VQTIRYGPSRQNPFAALRRMSVSNVISMDDRTSKGDTRGIAVRDRRYSIRYPFAADAELLDLESGAKADGVTSDISMGGAFICTSKPFPSNARVRLTMTRKDQKVEALGVVRIVKPRIGMGVEFIDLESRHLEVLRRWVVQVSKSR
jgi:PilZ domain